MRGIIVCLCAVLLSSYVSSSPTAKRTKPRSPCERIAEALMELTEHFVNSQFDYGGQDIYMAIRLFTGVDMQNEQRVKKVVCDLVELGTDADAVADYLMASGMVESFVKSSYDYTVASLTVYLPQAQQYLQHLDEDENDYWVERERQQTSAFIRLHTVLDNLGFLDLDPVGVQQFTDWIVTRIMNADDRVKRSTGSSECQELISILEKHVQQPLMVMRILGFQSEDEVQHIVCSAAGADSIDEIVELLTTYSIPNRLVAYGFSQLHHLRSGIVELENVLSDQNGTGSIYDQEHRAMSAILLRLLYAMRDASYF